MKPNLLITKVQAFMLLSPAEREQYIAQRDARVIELFKLHKTPTETAKACGDGISRWVVRRILSRAGLWNPTHKEKMIQKRSSKIDKSRSCYNRTSKLYLTEEHFQSAISSLIWSRGIEHHSEVQVTGCQSRADFMGADFIIEAKNSVASDDLCRGLGQCVLYRHSYPGKRVALVYPDDIEPKPMFFSVFAANGFSLISFSALDKWLP